MFVRTLAHVMSLYHVSVQPENDTFSIDYSLGTVSGHIGLDTLSIGQPPVVVTQQAFGLATASTADFSDTSCDGVFVSVTCAPPDLLGLQAPQSHHTSGTITQESKCICSPEEAGYRAVNLRVPSTP